jgi:predicted TIM-barrel fold metal-dependent hydrolase
MNPRTSTGLCLGLCLLSAFPTPTGAAAEHPAEVWRTEHRIIDLHQHIECTTQHLARAAALLDAVGVGVAVNLSGGTVTRGAAGEPSEFESNRRLADTLYPGRFVHYLNLDYGGWDEADFAARAVRQVEEGYRLGAAGLKEFKRLGLYLRDGKGQLIKVDDAKLDPVWERCGQLGMPVSIHVADPKAFWLPYNDHNERWKELRDHKNWWFGDSARFPAWKDLLESLNRVIARHPKTTFVCVHFANNAEELEWVDQSLSRYPNMMADLAARIPELGRHDPALVRRLFLKHQDRILFATDFQVYDRLILGSSGDEPPPADTDAEVFFAKEWRWLETRDRNWAHMTPIQGDWTISSIGLPESVLRKIYFDNARKLLARSLPTPEIETRRISQDFEPSGNLEHPLWGTAKAVRIEQSALDGTGRPELSTSVRALWSEKYLYLRYECPYTKLTTFEPPQTSGKRFTLGKAGASLWDRDVVEAFIGTDSNQIRRYAEFELAPTNERLDLMIVDLPQKDFVWTSGFDSAVEVAKGDRIWRGVMRVPLRSLAGDKPVVGEQWRINLFRHDHANKAFLAFRPPLAGSFHTPERFGILKFTE